MGFKIKPFYIMGDDESPICKKKVTKKMAKEAMRKYPPYSFLKDESEQILITEKDGKEIIKKHKKFKKKHGFEMSDCWGLDDNIAHYILPRLFCFKRTIHGHPWIDEDNCATSEEAHKLWLKRLESMIIAFYLIITKSEWEISLERELAMANFETIDFGLQIFAKYFLHLWD